MGNHEHDWELKELQFCHMVVMNDTEVPGVALKPKDGVVLVMVNDLPPFVLEHEVQWHGLVRVHCLSPEHGRIYYREIR
jgi:hypothetical protein